MKKLKLLCYLACLFSSVHAAQVRWLMPGVHDDEIGQAMWGEALPVDDARIPSAEAPTSDRRAAVSAPPPPQIMQQQQQQQPQPQNSASSARFQQQQAALHRGFETLVGRASPFAAVGTLQPGNLRQQRKPLLRQQQQQQQQQPPPGPPHAAPGAPPPSELSPPELHMKLYNLSSSTLRDVPSSMRFKQKQKQKAAAAANTNADTNADTNAASATATEANQEKRCKPEAGKDLGVCKACVYTLERIKQGFQNQLPAICVEIHNNTGRPGVNCSWQDETTCYHTLDALDRWGYQVKNWIAHGCYKVEVYGQVEKITPCPSHVICAQLQDPEKVNFCEDPLPELSKDVGKSTTWAGPKSKWSKATQLPTSTL